MELPIAANEQALQPNVFGEASSNASFSSQTASTALPLTAAAQPSVLSSAVDIEPDEVELRR